MTVDSGAVAREPSSVWERGRHDCRFGLAIEEKD